eukprot:scaffold169495_cov27-Prasinocladus_malaysianus.AAC.1
MVPSSRTIGLFFEGPRMPSGSTSGSLHVCPRSLLRITLPDHSKGSAPSCEPSIPAVSALAERCYTLPGKCEPRSLPYLVEQNGLSGVGDVQQDWVPKRGTVLIAHHGPWVPPLPVLNCRQRHAKNILST